MKKIYLTLIAVLSVFQISFAQTNTNPTILNEWNNAGNNPGEVIVATLNAGTIGSYTGVEIAGQIIDGQSNWGQTPPIVANFKLVINFSQSVYAIIQDVTTPNATLELKAISSTQIAIVANCPNIYKQVRIFFRYTNGNGPTLTVGDPTVVTTAGTMLVSQPTYANTLTGTLALNVTNSNSIAGYTLAVGGKAIAESVTVKLQGTWPDFVFNPTYLPPSLTDVKAYIDQNHHLPDMPSAQEIERNGLNLGEMNKILVKKVEELTLYLIEKDKENKDQSAKLNNQQAQIDLLIKQVAELLKEKTK